MRRIRIGLRLALGFGVLAIILLLQGMSGLGSMASMNSQTKEISNIWIPTLNAISDLNSALLYYRISAIRLVVDPSATGVAKGGGKFTGARARS